MQQNKMDADFLIHGIKDYFGEDSVEILSTEEVIVPNKNNPIRVDIEVAVKIFGGKITVEGEEKFTWNRIVGYRISNTISEEEVKYTINRIGALMRLLSENSYLRSFYNEFFQIFDTNDEKDSLSLMIENTPCRYPLKACYGTDHQGFYFNAEPLAVFIEEQIIEQRERQRLRAERVAQYAARVALMREQGQAEVKPINMFLSKDVYPMGSAVEMASSAEVDHQAGLDSLKRFKVGALLKKAGPVIVEDVSAQSAAAAIASNSNADLKPHPNALFTGMNKSPEKGALNAPAPVIPVAPDILTGGLSKSLN